MLKCGHCGTENEENAVKCKNCGQNLNNQIEPKNSSFLSKHHKKILLGLLVIFIALLALFTSGIMTKLYPTLGLTNYYWGSPHGETLAFEYPKNWVKGYEKMDSYNSEQNPGGSSKSINKYNYIVGMVYNPSNPLKYFFVYSTPKDMFNTKILTPDIGALGITLLYENVSGAEFKKTGEKQVEINPINTIGFYPSPFKNATTQYEYQITLKNGKKINLIVVNLESEYENNYDSPERNYYLCFASPSDEFEKEKENFNLIMNTIKLDGL